MEKHPEDNSALRDHRRRNDGVAAILQQIGQCLARTKVIVNCHDFASRGRSLRKGHVQAAPTV
jgi:hypothetical protein